MGNEFALVAMFAVRCALLALTFGVSYAYYERVVDYWRGRATEDRLGAAIWLFALGTAITNIHSGVKMIEDGMFHGSVWIVVVGLLVVIVAHYFAWTAWATFRFDLPARHVSFQTAGLLIVVAIIGGLTFWTLIVNGIVPRALN